MPQTALLRPPFRQGVQRRWALPFRALPLLPEQVGKMSKAIHHHLCAIQLPQAKNNVLHVISLLARNHIPELVAAFLDFSTPLDRYLALLSPLTPLPTLHPSSSQGHSFCPPVCPSQSTGTQSAWRREGVSTSVHLGLPPVGIPLKCLPHTPLPMLSGP